MTLDQIDYKLIDLLQEDGRMRKLENEQVIIGYTARVNGRTLGKDITAFVGVRIEHPKYNAGFAKRILDLPDVLECHRIIGTDSYLLKVGTENTESLDLRISGLLRHIPGVTRTLTSIVTSSIKEGTHIKPAALEQPNDKRSMSRAKRK